MAAHPDIRTLANDLDRGDIAPRSSLDRTQIPVATADDRAPPVD